MGDSRLDAEAGSVRDAVEQRGLGRGHPHLAAAFEAREQRGAADRVEMGRDLVEKQDRWLAAPLGDQISMREHETEEKRLLLAGRAAGGRNALAAMRDGDILAVRALGRPSRRGIARPIDPQRRGEVAGLPTFERDRGAGELVVGRLANPLFQGDRGPCPRLGNSIAVLSVRKATSRRAPR